MTKEERRATLKRALVETVGQDSANKEERAAAQCIVIALLEEVFALVDAVEKLAKITKE